ncbi:hypothetical protein [Limnoglobus roseus]|uniref:hypothetical protein n=1 Tax=Limnoglobus roseus TaxID=2598579 RepID=UPI0011EB65AB|nr:hypothetical protein [Limnoglobus roseus]
MRWIAAAPTRRVQAGRLTTAAKAFHTSREVLAVFNRLAAGKGGHRLALQFAARMPTPMPTGLILLSAPLLQARDVSPHLRVNVAGRLVSAMPDRPESIGPIVRALTAGLGKVRTLERLVQLQSRVAKSETLDKLVADAEAKTQLKCPKCLARLTRPELIKHLWAKHRLVYEGGGAREPGPLVERAVEQFTASREPEEIDRVYAITEQLYADAEPRQIHQAILSRMGRQHADADLLCKAAGEAGLGLCPSCYSTLPPSIPPTPLPLALADGRLVGEGYRVEAVGRKLEITYPDNSLERLADPNARSGSREFAARVGSGIAAAALLTAAFYRGGMKPILPTLFLSFLSVTAYTALLYRERRVTKPETRAVDAAWREVAPNVGRSAFAVRYLTRLCRASLGRGTTDDRSKVLWELVEHAAVLAEKGPAQTQLLAAARLLQAHDSARIGKEWVNQLLSLWEPFLRGEVTPVYAEAAADVLLNSDQLSDRDAARLRVQLPAIAFDAGLTPAGLDALAEACPNFRRLLAGTIEWFDLLFELWKSRTSKPWESTVGPAQSVIDITKKGSGGTLRSLLAYPDTLLVAEFDPPFDKEFGEVLVGRRGVTIGDFTVSDTDVEVTTETTRKGTNVLVFGPHRIATERKIPEKILRVLRGWLRFRAERLIPAAGRSAGGPVPDRVKEMLSPLVIDCPMCRTRSVVRVGEVGTPA